MIAEGFDDLERLLEGIAVALSPRERQSLLIKIGQSLRKSNAKRIAANVEPDGSPMTPRKKRKSGGKKGKMFPRLRLAHMLKGRVSSDQLELGFGRGERLAKVHHFGEEATVGYTKDGRAIRHRYAARRLLGIGRDDEQEVYAAVEAHLTRLAERS